MATEGRWLDKLEKKMGWLALHNLALFLSAVQGMGFLAYMSNPLIIEKISLNPQALLTGEIWRVLTFLAIPLYPDILSMFFAVWFLYFSVNALEQQWGEFKTTFYVFISIVVTVAYCLFTGMEIQSFKYIELTIIIAMATLYPDMQILLLFFPVKMKYVGLLSLVIMGLEFFQSGAMVRFYIVAVFTNYFVFFGGYGINTMRQSWRRWDYKRKTRR
ncbi:MAG: hypothetical protein OEV66_05445 [Spirochaetia bacterium]|nr:hypothetical protein [Spirochaetia bacterium]